LSTVKSVPMFCQPNQKPYALWICAYHVKMLAFSVKIGC